MLRERLYSGRTSLFSSTFCFPLRKALGGTRSPFSQETDRKPGRSAVLAVAAPRARTSRSTLSGRRDSMLTRPGSQGGIRQLHGAARAAGSHPILLSILSIYYQSR